MEDKETMDEPTHALESLWENLLSRQPDRIKLALNGLTLEEKRSMIAHLKRMAEEVGWHPEQRAYAQAALAALSEISDGQSAPGSPK